MTEKKLTHRYGNRELDGLRTPSAQELLPPTEVEGQARDDFPSEHVPNRLLAMTGFNHLIQCGLQ